MRGLFDTHILLDYLKGHAQAREELAAFEAHFISAISVVELHLAAREDQAEALQQFLGLFEVVPLADEVARAAVAIKREHRQMKLPHAVVLASARAVGALLVTRNAKAYPPAAPDIRVPY